MSPGLGLIALAGVAAAALMTWSVQDPSLSHATSRAIRNIVGYPGAIGADLLMQILGLGAIMLILPIAVWGWRMLTHRTFDREALRIGCWILCTVISAGFVSCWPHGGAWPLPTGLGGVVGDALVRAPAVVFGRARISLSPGARNRAWRGDDRDIPDRLRPRLAPAGRGIDVDRGRRRAVRGRRKRRRLGLAGMAVPCRDERQGAARLDAVAGLPLAGRERTGQERIRIRTSGAQSRRPRGAVIGAAGRGRFRGRKRKKTTRRRLPPPARRARRPPHGARAQIVRQVRTAVGIGADRAEGFRSPAAQQIRAGQQFARAGRRACRISACAAKSSRPIPARS